MSFLHIMNEEIYMKKKNGWNFDFCFFFFLGINLVKGVLFAFAKCAQHTINLSP